MKKGIISYLTLILIACNGENTSDCFQNAGDLIRTTTEVPNFTTITVFENINLVLKEGAEQQVEIETGEFLQNEVTASVADNRLILRNENGCNFIRDYGLTTIYVTSPNITEVRSSTGLLISSDGVLNYPNLNLISESFINSESETTDGSFDLTLNAENVRITVNGIAFLKLAGVSANLNVVIAAGDSRIEAEGLAAQNVSMNHRGSNDIIVNPQSSISGVIRGTGDVISINRPPEVNVEELFNGKLIFRD
ncbi:head GIN domain-containing protein [uncultured Allomuricauda sp.]|uniref:head GIN domain-containing protein n=1 Tax=Flagellimonas sp. W118 TaxID=3410791 RepID=UPI00261ACD24|nr:head GIN domain-containing protein [uncultured Allomuricauda sp.]